MAARATPPADVALATAPRFSANLGFLWRERTLPAAVRAAAEAGFDAVECHWPQSEPSAPLLAALRETGLPLLSLNTEPGDSDRGEFGLCAVPDRRARARAAIDRALDCAHRLGCRNLHLMAGRAEGAAARDCFLDNLAYAADRSGGVGLLIEPINGHDVPGYFLQTVEQAVELLDSLNRPRVRLMFDCYHVQRGQGGLLPRLLACAGRIGHIQIAGAPARDEPDRGEIDYPRVFEAALAQGYQGYFGAEYRPSGPTAAGLGWLAAWRRRPAAPARRG